MVGNPKSPVPRDRLPPGALTLTGFVELPVLERWLAAADCCVVPLSDTVANRGRWPAKISDYLCAGRPIVMTRVGDAARWVEERGAGWTAEPRPEALARALELALDAPDVHAAGARGRALAEGPLSWGAVAGSVQGFYRRLLDAPPGLR
jgi:glycosyltransferase involved in cell wall biosynthesis